MIDNDKNSYLNFIHLSGWLGKDSKEGFLSYYIFILNRKHQYFKIPEILTKNEV